MITHTDMISKNVSVNVLLLFSCRDTVQVWRVFLEFMQSRASSHVPVLQEQNIPGSVNNSYKKYALSGILRFF